MRAITIDQIIATYMAHSADGIVDSVRLTRCTAVISLYLFGNNAVPTEVQLTPDEAEYYKQLTTMIEDRLRREVKQNL